MGHADPPLSDLGERQARAAAPSVVALGATVMVSSDLTRARQTAELLAPPTLTPVVEPSVRERDVGEWTGLTTTEIDELFPDFRVEHRNPPGFEGDEPLLARVLPALESVVARYDADAVVVVVTHGGVIRTVERHLGATPEGIPNLGGRWLRTSGGGFAIGERALLIDPHDTALTIPQEL